MAESIEGSADYDLDHQDQAGLTFHDGTEVKAKNNVDARNYGAFGPNAQLNQYYFSPDGLGIAGYDAVSAEDATVKEMSGLKVVDDYTFTVELSAPNSLFETIVGYSAFFPMPDSFFADPKGFEAKPIGTGPFQFVSRTPSVSIEVKAFPEYKGERKAQVENVQFRLYRW
jgi:oligopeptide transport system substrate-binding protein